MAAATAITGFWGFVLFAKSVGEYWLLDRCPSLFFNNLFGGPC